MPWNYTITVKEPRRKSRRFTMASTWGTKHLRNEAISLMPRGSVVKRGKVKRIRRLRE